MYCNYSKDKFGNELAFIIPSWGYNKAAIYNGVDEFDGDYFEHFLRDSELSYFKLLELGWKPQQARQVLPNALKTELVMTGFISDWKYLFRLRTSFIAETGKPHPDMSNLCDPLYKEFVKRGFIEK